MSREVFLIIIAAMIAGAIGLGVAVYAVPLEEIVQFRALINAGLGAISTTNHPDNAATGVAHTRAPGSKASAEHDAPTRTRSDANPGCDPHNANCAGGSLTETVTPTAIPKPDVTIPSSPQIESGGKLQAPTSENEPRAPVPSSPAPDAGSGAKVHVVPGPHSKPPAKKAKSKDTPRSNTEN